jgi:outer membrane protein OmpA-like peptidoglycan-associated protein
MRKSFVSLASLLLALGCAHAQEPSPATASTAHPTVAAGETAPCGDAQVFFAAGDSELDVGARERLDAYAGCLSRQEIDTVYIAGMTDPEGTAEENLVLGRRRAFAVAEYLHTRGCQVDFVIRSIGEEGALTTPPLWPLERSAEVTAVATP